MSFDPSDVTRPLAYQDEEGNWHLRASGMGSCVPRFVLHGLGIADATELDEQARYYTDSGHWFEAEYKKSFADQMLKDYETVLLQAGHKTFISGNTDGLIKLVDPGPAILECKFLGSSSFSKIDKKGIKANPMYAWQISIYMHYYRRPVLLAMGLRPSDWDESFPFDRLHIKHILITEPPIPMSEIMRRANGIVRYIRQASKNEISRDKVAAALKETHGSTCKGHEYFCNIDWFHREQRQTLAERAREIQGTSTTTAVAMPDLLVTGDSNTQATLFEVSEDTESLVSLVADYVAARDAEKAAKDRKIEASSKIKELMTDQELEDFEAGNFTVTCKLKPGRRRLDRSQLTLDMGEEFVAKYYQPGPEEVRLDIREKRKK